MSPHLWRAFAQRRKVTTGSLANRLSHASRRAKFSQNLSARTFEHLEPRLVLAAVQTWQVAGAGGGGSLYSPSINPANPQEIFISSDMGQIFHTTTGGTAWNTVSFLQTYGGPNSQVQFTSNPSILYTIDYASGGDDVTPAKSTDGGATWAPLAADPTDGGAITLVADYNNPNRLIVSDYSNLWISTDGGAHFTQRFTTSDPNGLLVAGAFFDGTNIYVGTNQGLLISTNGGTSFAVAANTGLPSTQRMQSFAGADQNGTVRLWAVTGTTADVFAGMEGYDNAYAGVYKIDNPLQATSTWTSISSGITGGATPFYVSAALNDINNVYVAGGNPNTSSPTVFHSSNGGTTWQSVLQTAGNANVQTGWAGAGGDRDWSYGELALGFTVDPADATRLIITDEGFAYASTNSGTSWNALYVIPADLNPAGHNITPGQSYLSSGLDNTSSWDLTWTSPTNIVGSFTDVRSEVSNNDGASWSFNYTGDTQNTMYRAIVVNRSGQQFVYAATSTVHDMYQSTHLTDSTIDSGTGDVLFSTNGGSTWQVMHNFTHVVTWVQADPNNPDILYASVANSTSGGIYVTNDAQAGAASTWTKLAAPPRTQGHAFNIQILNDGTLVVTYSGRRDSTGAFTASSGVFISTNGGTSWQDVSSSGMLYWTKDITIDPSDPTQSTWYVSVFSGFGGPPNGLGGLYKTTNRGQTWTKINSLDRVNSLAIDPDDPNQAYLTTEVNGLWYTSNLQSATPTFTQVTSYDFMQPMRVFYNPYNSNEIWVTSFGGGLRVGFTNPPQKVGDFNQDGHVDASDLKAGMQALANPDAYEATYHVTASQLAILGDVDGNGHFNNADLQALLNLLISGGGSLSSDANQLSTTAVTTMPSTSSPASETSLDSTADPGRILTDATFAAPPHITSSTNIPPVTDGSNPSAPVVIDVALFDVSSFASSLTAGQTFSHAASALETSPQPSPITTSPAVSGDFWIDFPQQLHGASQLPSDQSSPIQSTPDQSSPVFLALLDQALLSVSGFKSLGDFIPPHHFRPPRD